MNTQSLQKPFLEIDGISTKAKIAQLKTVRFWKLVEGDAVEMSKLMSACEHYGFFYLDLNSEDCSDMLRDLEGLQALMKDWFKKSQAEKLETVTVSHAHG